VFPQSQKKAKILRVVPALDFGGVESRIVIQAALHDRSSYDLRVCTFGNAGAAAGTIRDLGVEVCDLGERPSIRNPWLLIKLTEVVRAFEPDIIHASISEAIFFGAIVGRLARVPIVIVEEVGIPNRNRLGRAAFGSLFEIVDCAIGVSQATCRYMLDEGADQEKLRLIYNCANPAFFEYPNPQQLGSKTTTFLLLGRLVEVKNHHMIVRAFSEVVASGRDVHLRIVGDGPLSHSLKSLVAKLGIEQHVSLEGFRRDVQEVLRTSDVFLLPSFSEGCSISLIEAMAMGLLPLGSTADGITEVMGDLNLQIAPDDVAGWSEKMMLFDDMCLDDRLKLGRRAQKIALARFSPNVYLRNVEALYRELLDH